MCIYIYMCVYIYAHTHIYTYVYMCIYTHMYIIYIYYSGIKKRMKFCHLNYMNGTR